jgi:hypothetical protein
VRKTCLLLTSNGRAVPPMYRACPHQRMPSAYHRYQVDQANKVIAVIHTSLGWLKVHSTHRFLLSVQSWKSRQPTHRPSSIFELKLTVGENSNFGGNNKWPTICAARMSENHFRQTKYPRLRLGLGSLCPRKQV